MARFALILGAAVLVSTAHGQTDPNATPEIDACGVLAQLGSCVVFEAAGGSYVIPDPGGFRVGDAVRVTGTLDPSCTTICKGANGCIRGATLYNPAVLPCGSNLPNIPGDLVTGLCSAISSSLLMLTFTGLWWTRRGPHPHGAAEPRLDTTRTHHT